MTWFARLRPVVAVSAVLILGTAGVAVQGRQQPRPDDPPKPAGTTPPPKAVAADASAVQTLAREQLELVDKALAALKLRVEGGETHAADPGFSLWERRRIEALRVSGADKGEMVTALEKYVEELKKRERYARMLNERDELTHIDVYDFQYRRREAEIWLNQEKAR